MYDISTDRPQQWVRLQPRLSISHLFIWTALSAAMMCWMTWEANLELQGRPELRTSANFQLAMRGFSAMIAGASLGGVLLFAARRVRGIQFPVAPGEWLWTGAGLSDLLGMPVQAAILLCSSSGQITWTPLTVASCYGIKYLIVALPYLLPALFCRERGPWKSLFWIATLIVLLRVVVLIYSIAATSAAFNIRLWTNFNMACEVAIAGMLLRAVVIDRHRRVARDWPHCAGILIVATGIAIAAVWNAWFLNVVSQWLG